VIAISVASADRVAAPAGSAGGRADQTWPTHMARLIARIGPSSDSRRAASGDAGVELDAEKLGDSGPVRSVEPRADRRCGWGRRGPQRPRQRGPADPAGAA
jgi:hypothetical protein